MPAQTPEKFKMAAKTAKKRKKKIKKKINFYSFHSFSEGILYDIRMPSYVFDAKEP